MHVNARACVKSCIKSGAFPPDADPAVKRPGSGCLPGALMTHFWTEKKCVGQKPALFQVVLAGDLHILMQPQKCVTPHLREAGNMPSLDMARCCLAYTDVANRSDRACWCRSSRNDYKTKEFQAFYVRGGGYVLLTA